MRKEGEKKKRKKKRRERSNRKQRSPLPQDLVHCTGEKQLNFEGHSGAA